MRDYWESTLEHTTRATGQNEKGFQTLRLEPLYSRGSPGVTRTPNILINSQTLCRLSYRGTEGRHGFPCPLGVALWRLASRKDGL